MGGPILIGTSGPDVVNDSVRDQPDQPPSSVCARSRYERFVSGPLTRAAKELAEVVTRHDECAVS